MFVPAFISFSATLKTLIFRMEKVIGLKAGYSWQMARNISLSLFWLHLLHDSARKGPTFEWLYVFGFLLWMSSELKQRCLSWARGWIKWPLEFPPDKIFFHSSVPAMLSVLLMSPANSWSDRKWLHRLWASVWAAAASETNLCWRPFPGIFPLLLCHPPPFSFWWLTEKEPAWKRWAAIAQS